MKNRKEYKVVVLNMKPVFIAYNPKCSGAQRKSFSKKPHERLFNFAKLAVERLKEKCSHSIVDGLVRVDIFQNENQELVVNEFESLDANYYTNEGT